MKIKFLISILAIALLFNCGSSDEGKHYADNFFNHVINEKYDSAISMVENLPLENQQNIDILVALKNHKELGKLISAEKKFGFSTSIKNGITTVKMPYLMKFEKGVVTTEVIVIDRGNGYKISSIN